MLNTNAENGNIFCLCWKLKGRNRYRVQSTQVSRNLRLLDLLITVVGGGRAASWEKYLRDNPAVIAFEVG